MNFTFYGRTLLRGMAAGVLVLAGVSGCSRSDRDNGQSGSVSGSAAARDTVAAADTTTAATPEPSTGAAMSTNDTAARVASDTAKAAAAQAARAHHPKPSTTASNTGRDTTGESGAAGYQSMQADTTAVPSRSDSTTSQSAVSADSSTEMAGAATPDTAARPSADMARDTSTEVASANPAENGQADTTEHAGRIRPPEDSTEIVGQVTTDTAAATGEVANKSEAEPVRPTADSAEADTSNIQVKVDTASAEVAQADTGAMSAEDTTGNAGRIRPPEDSTEVLGQVTSDSTAGQAGASVARSESDRVRPPEDSTELHGNVTTDNAAADAAGASRMGSMVTGPEAVALMSWAGQRCLVLRKETTEAEWDISDSPANLNPCGPGTMTLSPIRTGETH